jgi:hypothetical protein
VRKTLSHSKKKAYLQRHIDLEDAIYNFVRPHSALKLKLRHPAAHGRRWQQRTPAIAAGLTDHIWSLAAISGDLLSAVISIRCILGFRKDNPNVFNMLVQNLPITSGIKCICC